MAGKRNHIAKKAKVSKDTKDVIEISDLALRLETHPQLSIHCLLERQGQQGV